MIDLGNMTQIQELQAKLMQLPQGYPLGQDTYQGSQQVNSNNLINFNNNNSELLGQKDQMKNQNQDIENSVRVSGSTEDSIVYDRNMANQQQQIQNQIMKNQLNNNFALPISDMMSGNFDYQNIQLQYLIQQQQYQKILANQQLYNSNNINQIQQLQQQQGLTQNQQICQQNNNLQLLRQNQINGYFLQGPQMVGGDHYQFLSNGLGNVNSLKYQLDANSEQNKNNGSNNSQINQKIDDQNRINMEAKGITNELMQQNYQRNFQINNNISSNNGLELCSQQLKLNQFDQLLYQQFNENQLQQLQNQMRIMSQEQNGLNEINNNIKNLKTQSNSFITKQMPHNIFNQSSINLNHNNINNIYTNNENNFKNHVNLNEIQNLNVNIQKNNNLSSQGSIKVKKESENSDFSQQQQQIQKQQETTNLNQQKQQQENKQIDLKLADLQMKVDDKIDTQIWKQQIKPHTGHVPTNFMNILIPYLLKVWRNKIPCKKGKQEKQENVCDCKPCQEFTLLRGMKRNKRNVSIVAFKKLWGNKRIAMVSLDFLNHYSLNSILDKVGYRNPCTKISLLLCLKNFHAAVMKPETFYKLLP